VGQGIIIHEVSITYNDAPQSLGLLWTSDLLVAETYYLTTHNIHNRQVGLKPKISAGERPQTHVLDRTATGTGAFIFYLIDNGKRRRNTQNSVKKIVLVTIITD
jgi:hypothetical protein